MGKIKDLLDIDTDVRQEISRMLEILMMPYAVRDEDDFLTYVSGDWTLTQVGTAPPAPALQNEAGGVLLLDNDAADDNSTQIQKVGEAFKLASGYPLYFECRFKISDATQSDLLIGIAITDTTLIAAFSDGVFFQSNDGDANLDFGTRKNYAGTPGTNETITDTGVDLADDTLIVVGFFFDGYGTITPFVGTDPENLTAYTAHTANIPDDEELCISFAVQNGAAAAKNLKIDYYRCVQKRQ